jgi:hypothetical protein
MAVDTTVLSMPDSAMVTISAISTGRRCVGRAGPVTAGGVTGAAIPGQLRQTVAPCGRSQQGALAGRH